MDVASSLTIQASVTTHGNDDSLLTPSSRRNPTLPFLRRGLSGGRSSILGCLRFARPIPRPPISTAGRSTIRSTSTFANGASWCNWKNTRAPRIFSATTHISLPTPIPGSSTARITATR